MFKSKNTELTGTLQSSLVAICSRLNTENISTSIRGGRLDTLRVK